MQLIFMGTPQFAIPCLQALIDSKHDIIGVFTQPDRKKGRGQKLQVNPVKELAVANELAVYQPASLRGGAYLDLFSKADAVVVIAYGLILPKLYLEAPVYGCLNMHASLLPRWRGAAPIQRAIAAGDTVTGVCLMQMDEGLDTGAVFSSHQCEIAADDTSISLADKLAKLAVQPLLCWLNSPIHTADPQNSFGAVYAAKIKKQEAAVDWNLSVQEIIDLHRAFQPWPGLSFNYKGLVIKLHKISIVSLVGGPTPGLIIRADASCLHIATQSGLISVDQLQLPNKKAVFWQDFHRGQADFFVSGEVVK